MAIKPHPSASASTRGNHSSYWEANPRIPPPAATDIMLSWTTPTSRWDVTQSSDDPRSRGTRSCVTHLVTGGRNTKYNFNSAMHGIFIFEITFISADFSSLSSSVVQLVLHASIFSTIFRYCHPYFSFHQFVTFFLFSRRFSCLWCLLLLLIVNLG